MSVLGFSGEVPILRLVRGEISYDEYKDDQRANEQSDAGSAPPAIFPAWLSSVAWPVRVANERILAPGDQNPWRKPVDKAVQKLSRNAT